MSERPNVSKEAMRYVVRYLGPEGLVTEYAASSLEVLARGRLVKASSGAGATYHEAYFPVRRLVSIEMR